MGSVVVRPGSVALRIGEPISTGGLTFQDRTRLTSEIRARVIELVK